MKEMIRNGTCVIKNAVFDGAVFKKGVGWSDVFKVAVFKKRILKLYWLHLNICKPGWEEKNKVRSIVDNWNTMVDNKPTCRGCTPPRGGSDWLERSWSGIVPPALGGTLAPSPRTPQTAYTWSCQGTRRPAHGNCCTKTHTAYFFTFSIKSHCF